MDKEPDFEGIEKDAAQGVDRREVEGKFIQPIYWASFRKAPRRNGTWVTGFREFDTEAKRDQFVRNTKYRVTETGER